MDVGVFYKLPVQQTAREYQRPTTRYEFFISSYKTWSELNADPMSTFHQRTKAWDEYVLARDLYQKCTDPHAPFITA